MNKQWLRITSKDFQTHKTLIEGVCLFLLLTLNGLVNATTALMAAMREGNSNLQSWEPFSWELTSAWSTLLLIPLIAWFISRVGWQWQRPIKAAITYLLAALCFCVLHVLLMVAGRTVIYALAGRGYQFAADWSSFLFEMLYEARQDVWTFFSLVLTIDVYRYLVRQWLGDIAAVDELPETRGEEVTLAPPGGLPATLLLRKHGRDYLIKVRDVQWAEASGNYVNLTVNGECYPMRITLSDFARDTAEYGFIRTHRSYLLNPEYISHMQLLPSGDGEITMKDGAMIRLSRRYRKDFEQSVAALSAHF